MSERVADCEGRWSGQLHKITNKSSQFHKDKHHHSQASGDVKQAKAAPLLFSSLLFPPLLEQDSSWLASHLRLEPTRDGRGKGVKELKAHETGGF